MLTYTTFQTWTELLDAIRADDRIAYQAPMDVRPVQVGTTIRRDGRIRVTPTSRDADPFTADAAHLDRFRKIGETRRGA